MMAWRALEDRYRRLTGRERALTASLAALAALFAGQASFDLAVRAAADEENRQAQAAELRTLATALADERFQDELGVETAEIWRGSVVDTSLAGAQAQAVLAAEAIAAQAGLHDAEISMRDEEVVGEGGVRAVEIVLSSQSDWFGAVALLEALEQAEPTFALQGISVRNEGEESELRAVLRAPVLLEAPR